MSTTFGPPVVLAGPLPAPYPHGLFSAATIVPEPGERWANGANVRGYPNGEPFVFDPCFAGTFRVKEIPDQPDSPFFGGFTVYLADRCAARGIGTDSALDDRVRLAFQAVEQWAVEQELVSGGVMAANPYLADGNATQLLSGAATAPAEALAQLEAAIGDSRRAGIIHAGRATASAWSSLGGLRVQGDKLLTGLSTPIAAGGGYQNTVPDGEGALTDDQEWAWATGPVEIRRGVLDVLPGSLAEALDRETNELTYYAERNYLVTWDTQLQAAVLVDRSL